MSQPAPFPPIVRFSAIIEILWQALWRHPWSVTRSEFMVPILRRVRRIERRFCRMAARVAAGTYRPRRKAVRREPPPATEPEGEPEKPPRKPVPPRPFDVSRKPGWLRAMLPQFSRGVAGHLEHALLYDPEMVALMAATPDLGEVLRPLCRMLGIEATTLPPRPRKPRAPRPPRATGPVVRRVRRRPPIAPPPHPARAEPERIDRAAEFEASVRRLYFSMMR
jgi:hypothetical protein